MIGLKKSPIFHYNSLAKLLLDSLLLDSLLSDSLNQPITFKVTCGACLLAFVFAGSLRMFPPPLSVF